jgi:hypothetical protein
VTDPSLVVGDVLFEPHREQVAMRRRDTMDLIAILERNYARATQVELRDRLHAAIDRLKQQRKSDARFDERHRRLHHADFARSDGSVLTPRRSN